MPMLIPAVILVTPLVMAGLSLVAPNLAGLLTTVAQLLTLAFCVLLAWRVTFAGVLTAGWFYADAVSAFMLLTLSLVTCITAFYSAGYLKAAGAGVPGRAGELRRYYGQFNLFTFALLLTPLLSNLGLVWIALELTTLASVLLVGYENNARAVEAAWKYLIISTVGAVLGLWGTVLLYYASVHGSVPYAGLDWPSLARLAGGFDPRVMKLVLLLVLIGYGTKAGLAPMHTWLPDAHGEAPSPVSALLSGAKTSVSFYVVLRFYFLATATLGTLAQKFMLLFGLLSIMVAAAFILQQRDYKRLLAYSTVEHMGIAGIGVGFGTPLAIYGVLLHIFNHAITKSLLFYAAGNISLKYKTREMAGIKGLLKSLPFTGAAFLAGVLAVTGLPPSGIFVSKLSILMAGFRTFPPAAVFLLVIVAVVFFGFLRNVTSMLFSRPDELPPEVKISRWTTWAMAVSLLFIIGPGLFTPWPFARLLDSAVAVFLGR
jgi:hydrogenase-4 component F